MQCYSCSRLVDYLAQVKLEFPQYHCQPVPAFGAPGSQLLIVGLAPGKHGANASGIPFTGDASGNLLFKMLTAYGFAVPTSISANELEPHLVNCRLTNAVKCLPPGNKPNADEVNHCNHYLRDEINALTSSSIVLALGHLAHKAIIKAQGLRQADFIFKHGMTHKLQNGVQVLDSYHCSRYNLQTGRLTEAMFIDIFASIMRKIESR